MKSAVRTTITRPPLALLQSAAEHLVPTDMRDAACRIATPRFLIHLRRREPQNHENLVRSALLRAADSCTEVAPAPASVDLRSCEVAAVPGDTASWYHKELHYLSHPRRSGIHLGLFVPRCSAPICLGTYVRCDLDHIRRLLPGAPRADEILVLSRLVAHPSAPRNYASNAIAAFHRHIRKHHPEVARIVTYHDPNLFPSASVYTAANATLLGMEPTAGYLYLDGDYVTRRVLIERFGTANPTTLAHRLGDRIRESRPSLKPLSVYGWTLATARNQNQVQPVSFLPDRALVGQRASFA